MQRSTGHCLDAVLGKTLVSSGKKMPGDLPPVGLPKHLLDRYVPHGPGPVKLSGLKSPDFVISRPTCSRHQTGAIRESVFAAAARKLPTNCVAHV